MKTDFFANKEDLLAQADKVLFTGMVDEYFEYCYGQLDYRSLRFESEILDMANYQGNAVVNYTDYEVPYTRIIEHKHFEFGTQKKTVIDQRVIRQSGQKEQNLIIQSMILKIMKSTKNMSAGLWKKRQSCLAED